MTTLRTLITPVISRFFTIAFKLLVTASTVSNTANQGFKSTHDTWARYLHPSTISIRLLHVERRFHDVDGPKKNFRKNAQFSARPPSNGLLLLSWNNRPGWHFWAHARNLAPFNWGMEPREVWDDYIYHLTPHAKSAFFNTSHAILKRDRKGNHLY